MKKGLFFWELVEVLIKFFTPLFLFWGGIFVTKLINVLIGAVFGWFIGLFFNETFLAILSDLGIEGYSLWQIGAFLGFVGSFFGSNFHYRTKEQIKKENASPQPWYRNQ